MIIEKECLEQVDEKDIDENGEFHFPIGITSIGISAFHYCKNKLKKVCIPDSVTKIGAGAFYCCEKLETIILSKNIKSIKSNTFYKLFFKRNRNPLWS